MVFLAITVGFFVENYQQKLSLKKAEIELVKSFKNDLLTVHTGIKNFSIVQYCDIMSFTNAKFDKSIR